MGIIYMHLSLLEEMSLKVSSISQGIVTAGTVFRKHCSEGLRAYQSRNEILALGECDEHTILAMRPAQPSFDCRIDPSPEKAFWRKVQQVLDPLGESSKHHWQTIAFFMSVFWNTWQSNDTWLGHGVCFPQFTKYISMFPEGRAFTRALPNVF